MGNCTNEWCGHLEDDHVLARGGCVADTCVCVRYTEDEQ